MIIRSYGHRIERNVQKRSDLSELRAGMQFGRFERFLFSFVLADEGIILAQLRFL